MALRLNQGTSDDDRHVEWRRVVVRIHDEQVQQAWRHRMFRLVRRVFNANTRLASEGGFIFNWMAENYLDASLMLVRRELDRQDGTENLRNLLDDIIGHPSVLVRTRYVAQWPPAEAAWASQVFDTFHPASGRTRDVDFIDPAQVRGDLERVDADAERLRTYAERTRAHRTPERGIDRTVTFRDLHQAIADVRRVVGKYYALLTLSSVAEWEPVPQYDTLSPFLQPWVVDRGAVSRDDAPEDQ